MGVCRFADGAGMYDVTPIENMFLLEYLPTAPEGFLRVYLYMRMLALHPELGGDIEDVAQALRMDTDAVLNAMTYWERQGLVCRMSDRPPTYAILSMHGTAAANPMDSDYYEYRDFNASLQGMFGKNLLSPKQFAMAYDWLNILGFTQEAVLRMVEAQLQNSRARKPETVFARLDEQAERWSARGVKTLSDVERALLYDGEVEKTANAVFKQLSLNRAPSVDELQAIARWLNEWKFSREEILAGCAETVKARNPSVGYLDSVLKNRLSGQSSYFKDAQAVLKALSAYESAPSDAQLESYKKMLGAGFEPETILLAAERCRSGGRTRFDDLEQILREWANRNLFRRDAAKAYLQKYDRDVEDVRALLAMAGTDRGPRLGDLKLYEKWKAAHSDELICFAAECAAGRDRPMLYADWLLDKWAQAGVKTVDEARAQRQSHAAQPGAAQNPALNYEQREHQESDYDDLFVDLTKDYGEGGGKA